jgi:putative redox protein
MSEEPMRVEIDWKGGLQFTAQSGGHETRMDGDGNVASCPMELLLASLAGCMAIDMVLILQKRRLKLQSVRARMEGIRAANPPRRFTHITLHFEIAGAGIKTTDVDRAIKLSRETYCSVFATLRPDMEVTITSTLSE